MKKKLLSLLAITMMIMSITGCVKKKVSVTIDIKGYTNFASLSFPKGTIGGISDNYLTVELNKDGEYDVVIDTDDGKTCNIHISYEKGHGVVTSDTIKDFKVEWK